MSANILIINPNSNVRVTADIHSAMNVLRVPGIEIEAATLSDGPPGIECQLHTEQISVPLVKLVREREAQFDAFVIACFSDPGLYSVREATQKPVFGIAACGLLTALARGERFGIIAILERSLPRHRRYIRMLGIEARFAGEVAINTGVGGLQQDAEVLARLTHAGERLRDEFGADTVVLGCAGMPAYRARLEDVLGLPVIDPTQAAVSMAVGAVLARA